MKTIEFRHVTEQDMIEVSKSGIVLEFMINKY